MGEQYYFSHFVDNIFVFAACTAGRGIGKVASFAGKNIHGQNFNHEYFPPGNYQLYVN